MWAFIMAWNVVRGLGDVFVNGAGNAGMKSVVEVRFLEKSVWGMAVNRLQS